METLAYLYLIEEPINGVAARAFEEEGNFLMLQDFREDDRCELVDAEVDALEQSVVWMMP